MKDVISSELSGPFSGEDWFDPLDEAVRFHVSLSGRHQYPVRPLGAGKPV